MPDRTVVVVNTGSTSVKIGLYGSAVSTAASTASSLVERWTADVTTEELGPDRVAGIERQLRAAPIDRATLVAVAHRIVHGADRFDGPVIVDAAVEAAIRSVAELAPLHNLAGLDGITAARRVVEASVPQVAVFDTTFHRTMRRWRRPHTADRMSGSGGACAAMDSTASATNGLLIVPLFYSVGR